jgi:DNA-binding NarL/FixJ family response regulator
MQTAKSKCIVVGTTSRNFAEMIKDSISEFCRYKVIVAYNDCDLKNMVAINKPYLVLVDSCAWQTATPHMIEVFRRRYPKTLVAVFSYESMTLREAVVLIERGARGMVNFRFDKYAFTRGIRTLIDGEEYIPPEVEEARDKYAIVFDSEVVFTPREEQIYELLLQLKTSLEISEKLHITTFTVINHRQRMYRKCGVSNMPEFLLFAQNRGDYVPRDGLAVSNMLQGENHYDN